MKRSRFIAEPSRLRDGLMAGCTWHRTTGSYEYDEATRYPSTITLEICMPMQNAANYWYFDGKNYIMESDLLKYYFYPVKE